MKKDLKTAVHFLKLIHKVLPSYIPLVIVGNIFKAMMPFLNIIMPKFIIDELMGEQRVEKFVTFVAITVLGNCALNLINRIFNTHIDIANSALNNGIEHHVGEHIMSMDFESLEDPEILNKKDQALFPISNQGVIWRMVTSMMDLFSTVFTLIGLIAVVSMLSPILVVVIIVIVLLNSFVFKKSLAVQFCGDKENISVNREFEYYVKTASDFSAGKDVRMYDMSNLILKKAKVFADKGVSLFTRLMGSIGHYNGLMQINLQIQILIVYAYMAWRVVVGAIGIGDFTMYVSAANSFSTNLSAFLSQFMEFRQMCQYLDLYVEFESIPNKSAVGSRSISVVKDVTIEFKNVYFKYPRAKDYVLKDVSIVINNGDKLSIVGQNGAGKTTFIKLLCRLYSPEKGEILVNGVNASEYSFDEYIKLLSVVFQDFKLFSFTIKENMAFGKHDSNEGIVAALIKAGVYDKIKSLDKGINTSLYKNFDEKGVELSGGEMQKLAIGRAIYKESPIIILDEPTAALDPYAEFEIYSKFNELVQNKTAIYISHRLSSCKFCDKIAVFEGGTISQYGTHAELEKAGGKYSEMWGAQSQYYS